MNLNKVIAFTFESEDTYRLQWKVRESIKVLGDAWLKTNHIKAFYSVTATEKLSEGARMAIELCGLGKLSPNMLLLGFHVSSNLG